MANCVSDIQFTCSKCGERNLERVPVPGTDWSGDNADERLTQDHEDVWCNGCDEVFSITLQNNDGRITAVHNDHANLHLSASDAYSFETDDNFDLPSDPALNILMTLEDVREVLKNSESSFHTATLNRMAFVQQFAALEAYLSDTLVTQVLNKPGALKRVIAGDRELKEMKLSLVLVNDNPGIVSKTAVTHLRSLLYHNFKKVEIVWRHALNFDIFPSEDIRVRLMKAEPIRHDCVHRNGKDKDGNEQVGINDTFIRRMDEDLRAMVQHIEEQLPLVS